MNDFLVDLHLEAMIEGRVVPLLGAGANMCGRPTGAAWTPGDATYLPSGGELAAYLADKFRYPVGLDWKFCPRCGAELVVADGRVSCGKCDFEVMKDLLRVSQFVTITVGQDWLYDKLHELFALEYQPGPLHNFFAELPRRLREKGRTPKHQLIITTNYDDVLERAFDRAEEPYDLVWYVAEGKDGGKFKHRAPDGATRVVDKPNKYVELSTDERTVILKIHGAIDRANPDGSSFVITEDHYIEFLTRGTDVSTLVPVRLAEKMKDSHFLFLGYSLRDWNLRVILRRIWLEQQRRKQSWAIQRDPEDFDKKFWIKKDVDIVDIDLGSYIEKLNERLEALQPAGAPV